MAIGDFIGTFQGFEDIPDRFRNITEKTKKKVQCKFRLRADEKQPVTSDQFYGMRKDEKKAMGESHAILPRMKNS